MKLLQKVRHHIFKHRVVVVVVVVVVVIVNCMSQGRAVRRETLELQALEDSQVSRVLQVL